MRALLGCCVGLSMNPILPAWAQSSLQTSARKALIARVVDEGKRALAAEDPVAAYRKFWAAVRLDPRHPEANFYLAATRLLTWPVRHPGDFRTLQFTGSGGRAVQRSDLNPFHFAVSLPQQATVALRFETGTEAQRYVLHEVTGELEASLTNLTHVPTPFSSPLPMRNPLTGTPAIELDDADVALYRSAIHVALATCALTQLYQVDVPLQPVVKLAESESGQLAGAEQILQQYPALLRVDNAQAAQDAKTHLLAAIDSYLTADNLLRQETDDPRDDLFAFSSLPEDLRKEQEFRKALAQLRTSLTGLSDSAWTFTLDQLLHLGDFFDRPIDLRALETGQGVQETLMSHLLYQSERALANLQKAPVTFTQPVDPATVGLSGKRPLEVDYGDLLAMQATLEGLSAAVRVLASYDANVDLIAAAREATKQSFDVDQWLSQHPQALRVRDLVQLTQARIEGIRGLERTLDASTYVRKRDDADQSDHLFRLDGRRAEWEAHVRSQVEQLRTLVATIDPDPSRVGDEIRVNLAPIFDRPVQPRELLPQFDGVVPNPSTLPDPTLGGVLPDRKAEDWQ